MIDVLIKAGAVTITASACALVIKSKNPEFSFAMTTLCAVILAITALGMLTKLFDFVQELIISTGLTEAIFSPVLKCMAIAVLTKLICELCADAGQRSTAATMEYLGSVAAIYTVLPLIQSMLKTIKELT